MQVNVDLPVLLRLSYSNRFEENLRDKWQISGTSIYTPDRSTSCHLNKKWRKAEAWTSPERITHSSHLHLHLPITVPTRFRTILHHEAICVSSLCLNTMPLLVLSICLTCRFRVTVSALLSLVGPARQLLLPLAALKCDVFWANKFDLIWFDITVAAIQRINWTQFFSNYVLY